MPIARFVVLIVVIATVWIGIVNVFHRYGVLAGIACLILAIFLGKYFSKKAISRLKAKKVERQG